MTKIQKISICIVAVAVLLGVYIYNDQKAKQKETLNADNGMVSTTTPSGTIINTNGGGYKIEQVPLTEGKSVPQPIPDLNRPVTSSGGAKVSTEAIVLATSKILPLQAGLKKDPASYPQWLDLAMYQKMAGDYEGARISLEYATRILPNDSTAPGNLGNLYAYFLKDNIKAESYYKKAIQNGPMQAYLYTQLAEVYRDLFYDKTKALDIINQGLSKLPNDQNLIQMKASLSQ